MGVADPQSTGIGCPSSRCSSPSYLAWLVKYIISFRKVVDTSFMIDFLVLDTATDEDAAKYFRALRLAQRDIDVEPERYKHYLLEELPEKYTSMLDIRRCGIGEGLVFEPYTPEVFERTHRSMMLHGLFPVDQAGAFSYEAAVVHYRMVR